MVGKIIFLVDVDNLPSLVSALPSLLSGLDAILGPAYIRDALFRVYGGWFDEEMPTEQRVIRQVDLAKSIGLMKTDNAIYRVNVEFADHLVVKSERRHAITHTFQRRARAPRLVPLKFSCSDSNCEAKQVQRWLRSRSGCTNRECSKRFSDIFEHRQQKQVDVHLSVDLLHLAMTCAADDAVVVVSDDRDFVPAIVAASIYSKDRGARIMLARTSQASSLYFEQQASSLGVSLVAY